MSKELFAEQREFEAMQGKASQPTTVHDIMDYLINVEEVVQNGTSDPIVSLSIINMIEKAVKDVKSTVYNAALIEAENYPEKTFEHKGIKVERRNGRKLYDFKSIQEWNEMNEQRKKKEATYKAAYESYQRGSIMVDEETGERIPLPVVKNTKDVLVIKN